MPGGVRERVSVVAITPSSGGVMDHRESYYAERLADAGIAALVVDSFSSRGIKDSVHDQSVLTSWQTENDAVGALRWLSADGRFRGDKIGITGVSKGGATALNTALNIRRRWTGVGSLAFAAHVAVAPPCRRPSSRPRAAAPWRTSTRSIGRAQVFPVLRRIVGA
jgi:dienelactone hydrolase